MSKIGLKNVATGSPVFAVIDIAARPAICFSCHTYWHMGNIINRCPERDTYHRREKDGRLPSF